ncbi:MAG: hypothetical protein M1819_003671 [Sarea resinae]|nr:MAG: hypothetical protein M1819_003671 [Sarea resinae]
MDVTRAEEECPVRRISLSDRTTVPREDPAIETVDRRTANGSPSSMNPGDAHVGDLLDRFWKAARVPNTLERIADPGRVGRATCDPWAWSARGSVFGFPLRRLDPQRAFIFSVDGSPSTAAIGFHQIGPDDNMISKIAIEEAFSLPDLIGKTKDYTPAFRVDELNSQLLDIHAQRLRDMDTYGVDFMVLSLTSPGPQDQSDPKKAEALAIRSNDYLAAEIAKNPKRFGGFASLSMHDPHVAAEEAKRAIKELKLLGLIVNDFQSCGDDGEGAIFYDQPEWDAFWQTVQELDVPFYIHPRLTTPNVQSLFLKGRPWLGASAYFFSVGVSLHVLGIYCNGVFDRFPDLQIIIGHMGEHLPYQLWRIDHRLQYVQKGRGLPAKKTLTEVFKTNLRITTSGHFGTSALLYAIQELGIDRVMFSIDYPYDMISHGCTWLDSITELTEEQKTQLASGNAKKALKLA